MVVNHCNEQAILLVALESKIQVCESKKSREEGRRLPVRCTELSNSAEGEDICDT